MVAHIDALNADDRYIVMDIADKLASGDYTFEQYRDVTGSIITEISPKNNTNNIIISYVK